MTGPAEATEHEVPFCADVKSWVDGPKLLGWQTR
jgi:hypothetical protein